MVTDYGEEISESRVLFKVTGKGKRTSGWKLQPNSEQKIKSAFLKVRVNNTGASDLHPSGSSSSGLDGFLSYGLSVLICMLSLEISG